MKISNVNSYFNFILSCAIMFSIYFCRNNNQKNHFEKNHIHDLSHSNDNHLLIKHRDSLLNAYKTCKKFSYKNKILIREYELEVETYCLNDTLISADDSSQYSNEEGVEPLLTRPIIVEQVLNFKKKDIIIRSIKLPVKKIKHKNYLGKEIELLEKNVWNVFILNGTKEILFGVQAAGLCFTDCPEFLGIYSKEGIPIYMESTDKISNNNIDLDKILHQYGINNTIFTNCIENGIRTDMFWHLPNLKRYNK